MNDFMIKNWNTVASNEDTVFVVGDFFDFNHCTKEETADVLKQLNGHITLISGNHDVGNLVELRNLGVEVIPYPIVKDNFWILSHEPMYVSENSPYANIFAHVHNNPIYKTVSSRSFCVSAERIGYTPILLKEGYQRVQACAQIKERG